MHKLLVMIPLKLVKLPPYSRSKSSHLEWHDDILKSPNVDACYICTPDDLHETHTIACLSMENTFYVKTVEAKL